MIIVTNSSSRVTDADAALMTRACAAQLRHVAHDWGFRQMPVVFQVGQAENVADVANKFTPGAWVINIMDDSDQADALGWHTEEQGDVIYGRVFASPVLDNGGTILSGELSVSSVLSHEVVETYVDPHVQLWADSGAGYLMAYEACDPVESFAYPIRVGHVAVSVSDYVLPAYFDPQAAEDSEFDYAGALTAPFSVVSGGYAILMKEGKVSQVFGDRYPNWRKDMKKADTSRTARRV